MRHSRPRSLQTSACDCAASRRSLVEEIVNPARRLRADALDLHRSVTEARSIAFSVPKWCSSARLRVGPMPAISCRPASRMSRLRRDPMRTDGETVRFVAQPLDEIEHRIARRQLERVAARAERTSRARHPGPAPWRWRRAGRRRPSSPSISLRGGELALPAVDQHQIGPGRLLRSSAAGTVRLPFRDRMPKRSVGG